MAVFETIKRKPVSYTHLDVYKRQIEGRTGIKAQAVKNPDVCVVEGLKPVSYTHLIKLQSIKLQRER